MKATTTRGIMMGGLVMLYFTGIHIALGQVQQEGSREAVKRTVKEKIKEDSTVEKEEGRVRLEAKDTYKKSKGAMLEAAQKPHQISWEQGKVSSTFPESAKDLKQVNRITHYRNKPLKEGLEKAKRPAIANRIRESGEVKKQGIVKEQGLDPVGVSQKAGHKLFKKQETKRHYLDSLLELSELVSHRQEVASLEQGQLPSWVDQDMMSRAKTQGGQLMRVRSDKTLHQIEDSLNRYFPARRLLSIAQKKEEISPVDFVNLLGEQQEQQKLPSNEEEGRSAVMASAKEEVKEISSYRLPEEHLATLKTLQARQVGQLPQEVLDSIRSRGLRKNRIKIKEVPQSKTEVLNKIREKGRLRKRFFGEGILGGFSSDFSTFQLSPALGFKVFRTYSIGVGPMLSISRDGWNTTCDIRIFMKKEFFQQQCYLQLEDIMQPYSREKGYSIAQTLYAGAGYVLHISRMANLNVMGMYQLGGAKTGQPLIFRVGFSLINPGENK